MSTWEYPTALHGFVDKDTGTSNFGSYGQEFYDSVKWDL